ncbi:MAG: hypothetical protein H0X70_05260, partial [Segetibacter sp.]|nr:hypothetical protein [Segetibacter sp.]
MAWELGAEGLRKWDLIRWNKIAQVIDETRKELVRLSYDASCSFICLLFNSKNWQAKERYY